MTKKTRILIADDHAILRMGLAALFSSKSDLEVVGEACDGEEAVSMALRLKPDVVIMDLMMPKKDGVTATSEIHGLAPAIRILILTTFGTSDGIARAIRAGASGAIMKNAEKTELISALHTVADGGRAVSSEVAKLLRDDPPVQELSPRQADILKLVTQGMTNREIAHQFAISPESVKSHITTIFSKIGANSRSEAVTIALRKHLLKM